MDTQEHIKTQNAILAGRSETDEGPYYHESWWESYKGSVKGKLGGATIGALVGGLVGAVAATAAVATSAVTLPIGLAIAGGFAATGMIYGAEEFSQVGKVTGAVAAAQQNAEARMKSFENGKFNEIKSEISNLKGMITGKPDVSSITADLPDASSDIDSDYKTQHFDPAHAAQSRPPVFWNVALIGLVVGIAAGALLAFGGASAAILSAVTGTAAASIPTVGLYAASMATMGLFGASFGINRDVFRQIFDKTDLLFKGLFARAPGQEPQMQPVQQVQTSPKRGDGTINTIIYDGLPDYPQSDTFHRDKVLASARQALLSMDHTKSVPH